MIGYIKGNIMSVSADGVLIETGGIGYEVLCSASALNSLSGKTQGELYTYLQVREDGVSLFGFSSPEEKNMFLKLITVSGVGPKLGIAVLAGMDSSSLALAIASSDVKRLSTIKGLGKKTAERIILELREKVSEDLPLQKGDAQAAAVPVSDGDEDAMVALMTLGFTRAESSRAVEKAKAGGAATLEDIIRAALKSM
ncbi:MAG: Holliday junction branch migration protein RuvA [Clostridia bacterium]|nr:Holliday junction branch migration protein RuvA [Clostridia bacterium]